MSANAKLTGDRGAGPSSERRPTSRRRIPSDAIRTMRYEFQVDAGESYLEDMSWKPFTDSKRRSTRLAGQSTPPPKADGSGSGSGGSSAT